MRRRKTHDRDTLSRSMTSPSPSFWHAYLRDHASPWTRRLHYVGTIAGVTTAAVAAASSSPPLAVAALVAGYGPAWAAHALVERNKPASFRAPVMSLVCDFRMLACAVSTRLGRELARAGVK